MDSPERGEPVSCPSIPTEFVSLDAQAATVAEGITGIYTAREEQLRYRGVWKSAVDFAHGERK